MAHPAPVSHRSSVSSAVHFQPQSHHPANPWHQFLLPLPHLHPSHNLLSPVLWLPSSTPASKKSIWVWSQDPLQPLILQWLPNTHGITWKSLLYRWWAPAPLQPYSLKFAPHSQGSVIHPSTCWVLTHSQPGVLFSPSLGAFPGLSSLPDVFWSLQPSSMDCLSEKHSHAHPPLRKFTLILASFSCPYHPYHTLRREFIYVFVCVYIFPTRLEAPQRQEQDRFTVQGVFRRVMVTESWNWRELT